MLTHIVCWKYKEETTRRQREEHIAKLKNLPNVIPHILSYEIGFDVLHLERSFDLGLVAVFPDRDALDFYTNDATHREAANFGKTVAEKVVSVDFMNES